MDNLETPYDEEAKFIECTVCEKSLRGDTLYKIHLTTPGHIKKEDGLVAAGRAVRRNTLPEFKDILQYLGYLKLDEPIIGLSYLEEGPCSDPLIGPKYFCRLCNQSAILAEMVCHVIGRKHRQRYVEVERPDLMSWDKHSVKTLGGKIMRAKAEIIERQDGRGSPVKTPKKGTEGKSNNSKVHPKQRQNKDQKIPQRIPHDLPPLLPELKDYHQRKHALGLSNTPAFHPDEPKMNLERKGQWADTRSYERIQEELRRSDFREGPMYREGVMDSDYRSQYEEGYLQDPQRRVALEGGDASKYDYRGELPRGLTQHGYFPEEVPPYRRAYPERDPLQDDVRGGSRSAKYLPSQLVCPEGDKRQWSLERESDRHDSMNRAGRQGSSEPEAGRRNLSASGESDRSRDHLFNIIRDYRHEMREPHQDEAFDTPGRWRAGAPTSQRQVEVTSTISDIPEPFMRFLKGGAQDEGHGKRKRKSRFSDASPEELEMTREMDEYGPPNPKFGGDSRPLSAPMRPEIAGAQYSDLYRESQSLHNPESKQRGGSESEGVFDMLSNIEIENAEEADFLKNKLCSLLKEFKMKKLEKAVQNSREGISRNLELNLELPRQQQHERTLREDSHHRQPEDLDFRDWRQREHIAEERHHEYRHPVREEPRYSNRSRYEEEPGAPHSKRLDEPLFYPERFQEPTHPRDYQPPVEGLYDSHSSAPPHLMEQESRMSTGPRYSKNLDKITTALLELVARK